MQLSLLENAYAFLNESLLCMNRVIQDDDDGAMSFALVHIAQAVELMLKERLRREHPLLVLRNVDRGDMTVSVEEALKRLQRCGVELDQEEIAGVNRARALRNEVTHYRVAASLDQLFRAYITLLEFGYAFHYQELRSELHDVVSADLHLVEALCVQKFQRDLITYQSAEMISTHPVKIVLAQTRDVWIIEGQLYERDVHTEQYAAGPCHDCAVLPGQFHVPGCDSETCPRCNGQWAFCDCEDELVGKGLDEEEDAAEGGVA